MIGGALTMQSFSIPIVTFLKEIDSAVNLTDFLAGFVKSFVFAVLVAGIGCLRGLQTSAGASAVGDSATRAVVSGHHPARRRRRAVRRRLLPARTSEHDGSDDVIIRVEDVDAGYDGVAILERDQLRGAPRRGVRHPRRLRRRQEHADEAHDRAQSADRRPHLHRRRRHRDRRRATRSRRSSAGSASCTSRARCSAR